MMIPTVMERMGIAVLSRPTLRPLMMLVAWPVFEDSAMCWTGP